MEMILNHSFKVRTQFVRIIDMVVFFRAHVVAKHIATPHDKALNFALLVTFTFEDSNFLAFNNFLDTLIYHFELP